MKRFTKVTAFFAAFLLLIQPLGVVLAKEASVGQQIDTSTIPTDSIQTADISSAAITTSTNTPAGPDDIGLSSEETNAQTDLLPPSAPVPVTEIKKNTVEGTKLIPEVDNLTGALVYSFPIEVPPGRNNQTPSASLSYNSNNTAVDSVVGYGWSIDIPYISRINRAGSQALFSDTHFISSISGELTNVSGTAYAPKVDDGSFISYTYNGTSWSVVQKDGTTLSFGAGTGTRQDDPSDSSHVNKWMLKTITDTNGNTIDYEYFKNGGQIYPSKITYSNNGGTGGIFEIDFDRESRGDAVKTYSAGFPVTTSYRIDTITAKVSGNIVRQYALDYTTGHNTNRSLLHSITETAKTESGSSLTLSPSTFTYQTASDAFAYTSSWTMPTHSCFSGTCGFAIGGDTVGRGAQLADVNGDGLPDFVQMYNGDLTGDAASNAMYLNTGSAFAVSSSWTMPTRTCGTVTCGFPLGTDTSGVTGQLADVNGDSLPDYIVTLKGDLTDATSSHAVYMNTGSSFAISSSWTMPTYTCGSVTCGRPLGSDVNGSGRSGVLSDVNGDGLLDFVITWTDDLSVDTGAHAVYLNTGSGWAIASSWTMPTRTCGAATCGLPLGVDSSGRSGALIDVNGDSLPDFVETYNGDLTGIAGSDAVYLNTGSSFAIASSWTMPTRSCSAGTCGFAIGGPASDTRTGQLADVNGDGLPDFVTTFNGDITGIESSQAVYMNTGSSFALDSTWTMPTHVPASTVYGYPLGPNTANARFGTLADINGDSLVDFIESYDDNVLDDATGNAVFLNSNEGFAIDSSWALPTRACFVGTCGFPLGTNTVGRNGTIADVNNDGLPDFIGSYNGDLTGIAPTHAVYLNTGKSSDRLASITLPTGGTTTATYASQIVGGKNTTAPFNQMVMPVVASIVSSNGFGTNATTTYAYSGGEFHYYGTSQARTFAGFGLVTKTDGAGNVTKTYLHQGNTTSSSIGEYSDDISKAGKPYRIESYDGSNNLYQKTINKWDKYNIGTNHDFVKLIRTTTETYDGDSDHKDTATEYTYDNATGNVTQKVDWGEVTGADDGSYTDTGTDKGTTDYTYATNGSGRYALDQETLTNYASNKVSDVKYYYDTLSFGTMSAGNMTKERHWKSGSTWLDTQKAYNTTYGIVTSVTDPRSKVTSYSYDTYNLYPATVTDPLTHPTQYVYDYSSGKVTQTTDPNSLVTQSILDGLDRVVEEKIPDLTTPSTLVTKNIIAYTDTAGAIAIHQTNYLDSTTTVDVYKYFDGLNRILQERTEAETSNTFNVKDTNYNALSLTLKESLPYTSTGTARTNATTTAALYTNYTYDALQRPLTVSNNVGTTSYAYDQWQTTITDPNSKQKNLFKDAYDNLVKVEEKNSGSTYTTNYKWDLIKDLIRITDASSNIRNFDYDGLGRRTSAEDLHGSSDVTFGTWTYTYDDANNLTQSVNPNAQTVNYTYDDINRQLTEDYTGVVGTEVTYTYDTGTYGIGHLYNAAVAGSSSTTYTYNGNGGTASESEVINSNTFLTSYTYNRAGNQVLITYPDSAQVQYSYNTAGQLEKVQTKESGGSFGDVVSNFDYNPMGQVITQTDVNGVATANTYDATKLYRLTNRKTTKTSSGTKHQDLTFTYDNNGNITQLVDASNTNSAKTGNYVYDDLNRLTSSTITGAVSGGNYTHTAAYDALGNISSKSDIGTYLYQGSSGSNYANPHAATSINGTTYTYDTNGNMTGNGTFANTWDYKNQLSQTTNSSSTVSFYYDHEGNRARYTVGATTFYTPNRYYQKKGTTLDKYVFAGDNLVAIIETKTTVTPRYVHLDQLNSTAIVTSASGNQVQLTDYYPFGQVRQNALAGSFDSRKKYATHEFDDDTGFDYVKARYYLGDRGRFQSQDRLHLAIGNENIIKAITGQPLIELIANPQRLNSYAYGENNPLKNVDIDGNMSMSSLLLNPISVLTQAAFWSTGAVLASNSSILGGQSRPISASFIQHSLEINPKDLNIVESNQEKYGNVIDAIKNSNEFKSKVQNILQNSSPQELSKGINTSLQFKGDLFTALGKATISVQSVNDNDSYNLKYTIQDDYNFEFHSSLSEYNKSLPFTTANNFASLSNQLGSISYYGITIYFTSITY